ncbi:hypothetical protein GWI72_07390 [Microvirga tunisiensis]|uniref:Uncharacterized protein n=2 Tax=Pannonibacter tanglangensis TaxID=2750084 RepID=A0A7X5F1Q5_9HYPH|nr:MULTISPECIES: hypothetical protein [unclassified Pannonibacter]NBN62432.1 hypothetical protein [Pannonibacter sp. XCT-34]NBN78088.1 hypothetical protein [Pannonibacter sp. XCT-53]
MRQDATREAQVSFGAVIGQLVNDGTQHDAAALVAATVSGTTVLADAVDMVHLVVPATVDATRVAAGDETYFEELGRKALGACLFDVTPE